MNAIEKRQQRGAFRKRIRVVRVRTPYRALK